MVFLKYTGYKHRAYRRFIMEMMISWTKASSKCKIYSCGTFIIYLEDIIIGQGANNPFKNESSCQFCNYHSPPDNHHELICCVHAEINALNSVRKNDKKKLKDSDLLSIRLNANKNYPTSCENIFCLNCSQQILSAGIKNIISWQKDKLAQYSAQEFYNLSLTNDSLKKATSNKTSDTIFSS